MEDSKLKYQLLAEDYVNVFVRSIAGLLERRSFKEEEIDQLLKLRGGNDRIALVSEVLRLNGKDITFSFKKFLRSFVGGDYNYYQLFVAQMQQLLGHCWEMLKRNGYVFDHSQPMFEFYRYVRNAFSYGNRFYFTNGEPRYKAEWRGL